MDKRLAFIITGVFLVVFISALSNMSEQQKSAEVKSPPSANEVSDKSAPPPKQLDVGKELAKNMATGEVILMASCMGKNGNIPRSRMGDYIAAAVEEQGISRQELFNNWDKYWGYAKDAEKRNGTSCLN